MMLHIRDCPGTTSSYDICPYPWCRKTKHLLYHMISCILPEQCPICSPKNHSPSFIALGGLNNHRNMKQKRRVCISVSSNCKSNPAEKLSKPKTSIPILLCNRAFAMQLPAKPQIPVIIIFIGDLKCPRVHLVPFRADRILSKLVILLIFH